MCQINADKSLANLKSRGNGRNLPWMTKHLQALSIQNYRGIGETVQTLSNLKRMNLFCGANNSGKSTLLKLIHTAFPLRTSSNSVAPRNALDFLDKHQGSSGQSTLGVGFTTSEIYETLCGLSMGSHPVEGVEANLRQLLEVISDRNGHVWWKVNLEQNVPASLQTPELNTLASKFDLRSWNHLQQALSRYSGGALDQMITHTLSAINSAFRPPSANSYLIPAIRELRDDRGTFDLGEMSGQGLIARLSELQNPNLENLEDRKKFQTINSFLQSVTGESDARIEIPSTKEYVLVHMNNRVLPLNSLGTGIHEVTMLASYCTMIEDSIICIEEPEIHLHPLMQRKLIHHLSESTSNQYLIATHSASFIDTPGASVYRVKLNEGKTTFTEAVLDKHRFEICADLGCRASDLVQTNAIVWVEGPSDRIYLNHWIRAVAPELREGIHYSIMFYGGRLLSHLSAADDEIEDFIKLRSLNRNTALIMDSDKAHARARVNETKKRLLREFSTHGGVAWITKGREIENYVNHEIIHQSLEDIYSDSYQCPSKVGAYDRVLYFRRKSKSKTNGCQTELFRSADKIRVAKSIVEREADLSVLDLRKRIGAIVRLIQQANY